MRPLGRALSYLSAYWPLTLGCLVSLALVSAANLVSPQILRVMIDRGIGAADQVTLVRAAALLVGIAIVRGVFSFAQGYWAERSSQSVAYDLRNALFGKIEELGFSYHDRAQTGQLMTRVTNDVEQVRTFLSTGLVQMVGALALILGSLAALFITNWRLTLVVLPILPAIGVVVILFATRIRPLFGEVQAKLGALNTVLQENLAGVRLIQAFAREPYEAKRYRRQNDDLLQVNLQTIRAIANNFPLIFFLANLGTAAILWFGGHEVIGGQLSLGELVAINTYLSLLVFPVLMLGMSVSQVSRSGVSAGRIFDVLDARIDIADRPGAIPLKSIAGRVAFDDVSFRYVGSERPVLDHVSFVAEPGQSIALVGGTGSGKSTVINLIPRFYDATTGRVTVDGHDVRDVTLASLRDQIGIVLQDTTLFSGTIRDNIAYGRPEASDADVEAAARAASAHDFIVQFPDGYATIVGERGVGLSGGQKQRIAIARALLLDPRILILDDSTSAVDAETEYLIQQALRLLMRGRTSLVIAQRLSTVRDADRILLLDQGRLVAQGTHDDLLAQSALYGEIVDTQLGAAGHLDIPTDGEEQARLLASSAPVTGDGVGSGGSLGGDGAMSRRPARPREVER